MDPKNQPTDQATTTHTAQEGTITINAGVPGNIKKFVLEGTNWTVESVLKYAELDAKGYDIRVGGKPAKMSSTVEDGQTILLLRPVKGNTGDQQPTISVNAGVPGNIKKFVLEGTNWTVESVLKYAELDAKGYDIRVGGKPAKMSSAVEDGQTILLLRPVKGN